MLLIHTLLIYIMSENKSYTIKICTSTDADHNVSNNLNGIFRKYAKRRRS